MLKLVSLSKPFLTLLVLGLLLFGCRKQEVSLPDSGQAESLKARFFSLPATTPQEVQKVAANLKTQQRLIRSLPDFIQRNGLPVWDKALYTVQGGIGSSSAKKPNSNGTLSTTAADTPEAGAMGVFFIPLQSTTSSEIKSYITAYKHNDSLYTYRLYNRDSLNAVAAGSAKAKSSLLNLQAVFGYFEKTINNKTSIQLTAPAAGELRNVNIRFEANQPGGRLQNGSIIQSTASTLSCEMYFTVITTYEWRDFTYIEGGQSGVWVAVSEVTVIEIYCDGGGGGGDCGCGGGDPYSGDYWGDYGTGYPYGYYDPNYYGNSGYYDPYRDPSSPYYAPDTYDNWYPYWTGGGGSIYSPAVNYLINTLGLDGAQSNWLSQHPDRASEIYNYLVNTNQPEANEISLEHLYRMMNDPGYLSFVEGHAQTGNPSIVWWEDDTWLSDPGNFNLDITRATNEYGELTAAEKLLIAKYPVQAFVIRLNMSEAFAMSETKMGPGGGLNDKKDAFRHAYFNAINTRDVPPGLRPIFIPGSEIVRLFGMAHESEVPSQLELEKQMDLHNNDVGINYCWNCFPGISSNNSIADDILTKLNNGELRYLRPLLTDTQDPNFWGMGGINDPRTATHGIYSATVIIPTNQ